MPTTSNPVRDVVSGRAYSPALDKRLGSDTSWGVRALRAAALDHRRLEYGQAIYDIVQALASPQVRTRSRRS